MEDYGIVYKCFKIRDGLYILDPKKLIKGYNVGDDFYYENEQPLRTINGLKTEKLEYVVDGITNIEVLTDYYDEHDDLELVRDIYFAEQDDFIVVVQIKNGELTKRKIKREAIFKSKQIEIFDMSEAEPFVLLDSSSFEKLLAERDINAVRKRLEGLQKRLLSPKTKYQDRIKTVRFENNEITDIRVDSTGVKVVDDLNTPPAPNIAPTPTIIVPNRDQSGRPTFSLKGLEDHLNEIILGHEQEIRQIATIVYNNYKAQAEDTIQSILIPGPTGTGKTETARAICNYLGVPFKEIDCSTLVPEGIVGTRLADELKIYLSYCNNDPVLAQFGILIMDEFDKIALTGLDIKAAARFEMLKFTEGKKYTFEVKTPRLQTITLDTSRIMKFFLGAFTDATTEHKSIGFYTPTKIDTIEDMEKIIIDNSRFEQELLSRIQQTIPYRDLTEEDKKRIILYGKKSIFVEMKRRILRDYGVTIEGDELFAQGIIDQSASFQNGIRHLNNIIFRAFNNALYELGTNEGKYKKLILTRETSSEGKFDLL